MRRLLLLAILCMVAALALAPAALADAPSAQDDQYAAGAQYDQYAAAAQYDQYVAPETGTILPDTGGPTLLPLAGALLVSSGLVGLGAARRRS